MGDLLEQYKAKQPEIVFEWKDADAFNVEITDYH